jgi:diguanylate cyclase (GGDEF)-like protein/PAS domain S-box-containing protein
VSVGIVGVAVVVLMAVIVAEVAAHQLRSTAADAAVHNVEAIVRGYVDPRVREELLQIGAPVDPTISEELERITLSGDIREISIFSRDGRVAYSTNAAIAGQRFSVDEMLSTAFIGRSVSEYRASSSAPAGTGAVDGSFLDIYVPIRGSVDGNPIGVYSVAQDARGIDDRVQGTRQDVFLVALGAASLLLLVLVAAFGGASARLAGQNRQLRERAARERLLADDLRHSEERFRSLVRNSSDVILIVDAQGTVLFETPAVEQVLGYEVEARVGQSAFDIAHPHDVPWLEQMFSELTAAAGAEASADFRARHADGSWRWIQGVGKNLLHDPAVSGVVINYRDITERRSLEEQLRYQAFHDALTGLPNRALFLDRLEHALTRAHREEPGLAVLFVDLDDFKSVNDSLGHGVGDELLVKVAERLRRTLRDSDTAARMGGDEFAVLLEDARDAHSPEYVGERILAALRDRFELNGQQVRLSGSVGIAIYQGPEHSAEELLRHADVAMYVAKQQGKDRLTIFESELHHATIDRHQLRAEMHDAFESSQFALVYQPLVALSDSQLSGVEALLRWNHPVRGEIGPVEFIPLAEESGLIVELGRWVLGEACRTAQGWIEASGRPLEMSLNLSSRQVEDPELVGDVESALVASGLCPELLTLEITESVLLRDVDAVLERLTALKRLGVRLAIDDFGTGYSSLSYLRRLPVDVLKIDRSFISGIENGAAENALVRSIVSLAQLLELRTVAEGIEDGQQLEALRALGVDSGQGFHFARPLPAAHVAELLSGARQLGSQSRRTPRRRVSGRGVTDAPVAALS